MKGNIRLPIIPILGLLFVALKLTGHIDWSWLWVTAPFWGSIAILLAILICTFIFGILVVSLDTLRNRKP